MVLRRGSTSPIPYEYGTGLQIQWSRLGVRYAAPYNAPEFYGGLVPATNPDSTGELHFRRSAGCCYYPPFGDAVYTAWETYEGRWRFGVVLNDGGRAEYGEPPLLTLSGPRTDQPLTDSATFTLTAAGGGTLTEVRWWFIQPASNTFSGDSVPFVPEPFSGLLAPRYPDGQRTVITAISRCAQTTSCRYQAAHPGAVVAMAKMPNGDFLGARNTGSGSAPSVSLTIVRAAGPNPGGSFIVQAPENVIRLEALVTPSDLAPMVEWEIEDDPDDFVNTMPPAARPRGASTSFAVPATNISPGAGNFTPGPGVNPGRWPKAGRVHHDTLTPVEKAADLRKKSLGYRITALVTSGGQTFRSQPVLVRQDEIDTVREEYVEFGQRRVLARSEFGTFGPPRAQSDGRLHGVAVRGTARRETADHAGAGDSAFRSSDHRHERLSQSRAPLSACARGGDEQPASVWACDGLGDCQTRSAASELFRPRVLRCDLSAVTRAGRRRMLGA